MKAIKGAFGSEQVLRILGVVGALMALTSALVFAAGAEPVTALKALVYGAFGETYLLAETLVTAIPLALVGLSVAPALRAGIFTIGSQGQLVMGAALSTALLQAAAGGSPIVLLALGCLGGIAGGVLFALIPALLRLRFSVNEILSTLLLNYIAGFGLLWILKGPLAAAAQTATPRSNPLPDVALIPTLIDGTRLHWGLVLVPILAVALWWWGRSRSGLVYRLFSTHAKLAARLGLSSSRATLTVFIVAGGGAGLAGWAQVAGVTHTLYPSVDGGLGFSGILVAILGGLNPLGILAAALGFAALSTGAQGMQMGTSVPATIAVVVEGLTLLIVALAFRRKTGGV
ncbi:ABC transporter permease [Rhizobium sp. FKL33]|uniref:ABC transporter permease n=1 Tax=Rhizobium sp. FKL33 TaxID=2562307 RepID=UPI0010C05C97|nr:ABC transporter permease [Rhizobium sp. FKL33]